RVGCERRLLPAKRLSPDRLRTRRDYDRVHPFAIESAPKPQEQQLCCPRSLRLNASSRKLARRGFQLRALDSSCVTYGMSKRTKPSCSKCRSVVRASVIPRSRISTKLTASQRVYALSVLERSNASASRCRVSSTHTVSIWASSISLSLKSNAASRDNLRDCASAMNSSKTELCVSRGVVAAS